MLSESRADADADAGSDCDCEMRGDGDRDIEIVDVRDTRMLVDCTAVCVVDAEFRVVLETLSSGVSLDKGEDVSNADALLLRVGAERLAEGDVSVERDELPEFDADPENDAEADHSADALGLSVPDVDHDVVCGFDGKDIMGVKETVIDAPIVDASEIEPVTDHDSVVVDVSVGVFDDDLMTVVEIETDGVFVTWGDAVRVAATDREMESE